MKRCLTALAVVLLYGCGSSTPPRAPRPEELRGTAGWVGQEFAGRTTANGEIFDPMQLTGAHRTLPFGTILTVKNTKTGQTVRVRINDRGPYISNRVIDLSYAAAKRIGIVESGGGPVEMAVVKLGQGDKEPPAPYVVSVPEVKALPAPATTDAPPMAPAATSDVPAVVTPAPVAPAPAPAAPAPAPVGPAPVPFAPAEVKPMQQPVSEAPATVPVIVTPVQTRRQVSPDGKRVETVPLTPPTVVPQPVVAQPVAPQPVVAQPVAPEPVVLQPVPPPPAPVSPRPARRTTSSVSGRYAVQVGAFSQPSNAKIAMDDLARIGEPAYIDHRRLLVVYAGPYDTQEAATQARARIVGAGMEGIVLRRQQQ